jgi:hypothetical protein
VYKVLHIFDIRVTSDGRTRYYLLVYPSEAPLFGPASLQYTGANPVTWSASVTNYI